MYPPTGSALRLLAGAVAPGLALGRPGWHPEAMTPLPPAVVRLAALASLIALGCNPTQAPAPAPPLRPIDAVMVVERRAVLVEGEHRRWLFDGGALPTLIADPDGVIAGLGQAGALRARLERGAVQHPLRVRLAPPAGPALRRVELSPAAPMPPGPAVLVVDGVAGRWQLPIDWSVEPTTLPALAPIAAARSMGDPEVIRRAIASVDRSALSEAEALWWPVELARAQLRLGDLEAAANAWTEAGTIAERLGVTSEVARRASALAWVWWRLRRLDQMQAAVERAEEAAAKTGDPRNRINAGHQRGVLALELAEYRVAQRAFDTARAIARAADQRRLEGILIESSALALDALGLVDAARQTLAELAPRMARATGPARSRYALNRGWLELRAVAVGLPGATIEAGRAALQIAAEHAGDPRSRAHIEANLAWAALLVGDEAAAGQHRDAARRLTPILDGVGGLFLELIDAELAVDALGVAAAVARYGAIERRARAAFGADGADMAWRARYGAGRARLAGGDRAGALLDMQAALIEVERLGRRTRLQVGRGAFFADRRRLVEDVVTLLLEADRPGEAFAVAESARAQVLRAAARAVAPAADGEGRASERRRLMQRLATVRGQLEAARAEQDLVAGAAQASWRARLTELEQARQRAYDDVVAFFDGRVDERPIDARAVQAALAPDALLVSLFLRSDGAGDAFIVSRGAIRRAPLGGSALPAQLAAVLDEARQSGPVEHIYLVAGGHPDGFSAAYTESKGTSPLIDQVSVSWLPHAGALLTVGPRPTGAMTIVADPSLDLPEARRGGRALAEAHPGARLLVGAQATADALVSGLQTAPVVHFSGHGVLRDARPWGAHLVLADGRRFDVVDALGIEVAGGVVLLNGCTTGPDRLLLRDDVLGLPEALLARGAAAVIATDRPVPDASARRFTEAFYAAGGAERPAEGVRAAAGALRAAGDPVWSAWRVIGRRRATPPAGG